MAVSNDIRKRLLYAKYLLSRARSAQGEGNELGVAVSLLLMHDAAEMLMLAVVDHLQVNMPKKWDFMDFWAEIKKSHAEPPQRIAMESMNKMRVALKHNGTLPHAQTVRDLLPRLETLCEEVANTYLDGLNFGELSLADLIENDDVRNLLGETRRAFAANDKAEAFIKLKVAFDTLNRQLPDRVQLIRGPRSVVSGHWPHAIRQMVKEYEDVFGQMVRTVNMLTLGIDPIKHASFSGISPGVLWTMDGTPHVQVWRSYDDVPAEVFEIHFSFVVEVSLRISEVFKGA
jgi:hypothetical protein